MWKTSRGLSTVPPHEKFITQAAIYSHRADYFNNAHPLVDSPPITEMLYSYN